tara:strand:+ start:1846 stop:2898 length:1053 start_codon:yes stop_codon:yes gene_type:complete
MMEADPVSFIDGHGRHLWGDAVTSLSEFLNAEPSGMAFVPNATSGVNTVLSSLDLGAGDEVLVTDTTYQACRNAVDYQARNKGFKVEVAQISLPVTNDEAVIDSVLGKISERTRLALIDTVSSPTGIRLPFEKLIRILGGRGVDVLLDAAHGPGLLPIDLKELNVAFATGNCHKWLCTPKGSAFLYAREDKRGLRPLVISHGATLPIGQSSRFRLEFDWTGTVDPTPWMCIPFAISFFGSLLPGGWQEVMARNRKLALTARRLIMDKVGLDTVCSEDFISSMVAFVLPGEPALPDPDPLHEVLLKKYKIQIPVYGWPEHNARYIRISCQLYNNIDQYDRLADALNFELRA